MKHYRAFIVTFAIRVVKMCIIVNFLSDWARKFMIDISKTGYVGHIVDLCHYWDMIMMNERRFIGKTVWHRQ